MKEMTLQSRHRIRNSSPGGVRTSSLLLGHGGSPQYLIFTSEQGRNVLLHWNLNAREVLEPAISDFPSRQLYQLHQGPIPVQQRERNQTQSHVSVANPVASIREHILIAFDYRYMSESKTQGVSLNPNMRQIQYKFMIYGFQSCSSTDPGLQTYYLSFDQVPSEYHCIPSGVSVAAKNR